MGSGARLFAVALLGAFVVVHSTKYVEWDPQDFDHNGSDNIAWLRGGGQYFKVQVLYKAVDHAASRCWIIKYHDAPTLYKEPEDTLFSVEVEPKYDPADHPQGPIDRRLANQALIARLVRYSQRP